MASIKAHERRVLNLANVTARMQRKDFIRLLGRQPDQPGVGGRRTEAQAEVVVGPARK